MVNSKFIRSIAGVSVLFAAVAAHAQAAQTDTRTDSAREGTVPTNSRDQDTKQSQLQQGVMQSSTRQSGTQQTGMENGRFDKSAAESGQTPPEPTATWHAGTTQAGSTQSGATQSGTTQSGAMQSIPPRGDPANAPAPTDRSREAQDARSGVTPETMTGRSGTAGTAAAGGKLATADSKAIMDMAMANMAEVEMGKMAQNKGSSEEVKAFGQKMIDDHGAALAEVQAMAQAKGVTLPTALDAKHRAEADKLGRMSGAAFDKAYMDRAGVKDHKAVHGMLNRIESSAKDPDVKAMATKMKPVVQQHLHSAQQMGKSGTSKR